MKKINEYIKDTNIFETKEYEYKITLNKKDPVGWIKTIVAFSNIKGGKLFIGVTDEGVAVGFKPEEIDDIQKYFVDLIKNKVNPLISYETTYIKTDEGNIVICLDIPEYHKDIVTYRENPQSRGRVFVRYPGSTYELIEERDITALMLDKSVISYDEHETNYNADNFTFKSLNEKYKERLNTEQNLTIKQLKSVGLITDNNKLTIAGMYFADECPREFPAIHLRKWPGLDKGSDYTIDAKEFRINLIEQLNEAEKFIRNNTKTGMLKGPSGATNILAYPAIAVTEALCNAIGHRDYLETYSNQIDVDIYQDRIEIVSPGNFLPDGRAQDYDSIDKIPSKRRNRVICDTFAMCNLMQRYGSGFDKIVAAYKPYGEEFQPEVFSNASWFRIVLKDITYKEETSDNKNVDNAKNTDIKLPKNQKIVYETILNNPGLRIPVLSEICGLKESSINNSLFRLRKLELIEFKGSSKDGGYFVKK